jgi:L-amino acid N-acyltransferase YncA
MHAIRLATAADGPALAEIYASFVVSEATSFELEPPSGDDMARRVEAIGRRTPWLVCEHEGRLAGYAYASRHRERAAYQWAVDVSAYVHPAWQRRGIARALYTALFRCLARQGFYRAYAGITLPNEASIGLHVSSGFSLVGVYHAVGYKLGRWHDVAWYERSLQPLRDDPAPPTALADWSASSVAAALGSNSGEHEV